MRITFALLYVVVICAVAVIGIGAVGSARDMSVKQQRELDIAIDRIVADYKESKDREDKEREAALAAATANIEAETAALASQPGAEAPMPPLPPARSKAAAEADLRSESKGADAKTEARKSTAETRVALQKSHRARTGRHRANQNMLPYAFLSLPKFAATTLLGLR